jgi:hypothetical protein
VWNVLLRFVPTNWKAEIAATAIRAAIKPYSIAVAPSSFFQSFISVINMNVLQCFMPRPKSCVAKLIKTLKFEDADPVLGCKF